MNEAYISVMDALYIGIRSWRRKGCRPFCLLCSLKKSFAARDIINGQIIPESDDYDPEEYYVLLFFLRSLSFQSLFKLVYEGKGEQAKRQEDDDVDAEGTSRNVFCKEVWLQVDEEVQHDRQDHAVG